jgi:hypothetical protein
MTSIHEFLTETSTCEIKSKHNLIPNNHETISQFLNCIYEFHVPAQAFTIFKEILAKNFWKAMFQVMSYQQLAVEAWVQSHGGSFAICSGQSSILHCSRGFPVHFRLSPTVIIPSIPHAHISTEDSKIGAFET